MVLGFVDITEIERAQSELRRNRALAVVGQMTAQIAHEIKNPLGSIRFAVDLLKRSPSIAGKDEETLDVINRSVEHLTEIVSELSEFARPKSLNNSDVSINDLLDNLDHMLADRLNAKNLVIEKDFAPDLPSGYYDATELRKLFLNLIINAIDATETGGRIKLQTRLNGEGMLNVDVIDKGSGMDKETLRRLFEPFYTTKSRGTGLGMAISKKIAELHRGDLVVASKEGEGTTVTVRLPVDHLRSSNSVEESVNRAER
jgi:signal transduction histidine kinase